MSDDLIDLATHRGHFISAQALADYLAVDRRTIVRMIQNGSLEGVRVGRAYRIPIDAARAMFHVERTSPAERAS